MCVCVREHWRLKSIIASQFQGLKVTFQLLYVHKSNLTNCKTRLHNKVATAWRSKVCESGAWYLTHANQKFINLYCFVISPTRPVQQQIHVIYTELERIKKNKSRIYFQNNFKQISFPTNKYKNLFCTKVDKHRQSMFLSLNRIPLW